MTAVGQATDATLLDVPSAESTFLEVNGVRLHVVTAGNEENPAVVLLHGFPEFWYCWYRHVGPLVDAGYRVLVPDQRGYNLSEKPDGVRPYAITELSADIIGMITAEGDETAHVAGHDWGAYVAWDVALRHPDHVDRLGIINAPHPIVFQRTLRSNLRQLRKSWYVFYFQIPRIPEWSSKRNDFEHWIAAMRDNAEPGTFTDRDFERYRAAWRKPGAPPAMINWYRAAVRHGTPPPRERVTAPTVVIWGENDQALVPEMAPESVECCTDGRLERFPDASHWIHHERPADVTQMLLDHFGGAR